MIILPFRLSYGQSLTLQPIQYRSTLPVDCVAVTAGAAGIAGAAAPALLVLPVPALLVLLALPSAGVGSINGRWRGRRGRKSSSLHVAVNLMSLVGHAVRPSRSFCIRQVDRSGQARRMRSMFWVRRCRCFHQGLNAVLDVDDLGCSLSRTLFRFAFLHSWRSPARPALSARPASEAPECRYRNQ